MMLKFGAVSRDILIALKRICINNWIRVVSCKLSHLKQQERFTIISVSCLLSYGMAMNRDLKLRFVDILLEKTMKIN